MPSHAYSELCSGGSETVEGNSTFCMVKADFRRPVLDIDGDGNLLMTIPNSQEITFYQYHLAGMCLYLFM